MRQGVIQRGNIGQKLISAFGLHGKTTSPVVGDVVHPVVIVENITAANWFTALAERPCMAGNFLTPTVGQFQSYQLFNPLNSGVIAILDQVDLMASATSTVFMGIGQVALATTFPALFRDTLNFPTGTPACVPRSADLVAAGFGSTFESAILSSTIAAHFELGIILAPGWGVRFDLQTATNAFHCGMRWRERFQEEL